MRKTEKTQQIMDLLNGKRTCEEISHMTGLPRNQVYSVVRRHGRNADLRYVYRSCAPKDVTHSVVLRSELNDWVRSQTPKGAQPTDLIAAIIEDAFIDAQEAGK